MASSKIKSLSNELYNLTNFGGLKVLSKSTNSSSETVSFTFAERFAGFLFISSNGKESAIYEIHSLNNDIDISVSKIAGYSYTITTDANVLSVRLGAWANALAIINGEVA